MLAARCIHCGLQQEWQAVPEFESDHGAVLKPRQFVKEIADGLFKLEVIRVRHHGPTILPTQSCDTHNLTRA